MLNNDSSFDLSPILKQSDTPLEFTVKLGIPYMSLLPVFVRATEDLYSRIKYTNNEVGLYHFRLIIGIPVEEFSRVCPFIYVILYSNDKFNLDVGHSYILCNNSNGRSR